MSKRIYTKLRNDILKYRVVGVVDKYTNDLIVAKCRKEGLARSQYIRNLIENDLKGESN